MTAYSELIHLMHRCYRIESSTHGDSHTFQWHEGSVADILLISVVISANAGLFLGRDMALREGINKGD